MYSTIRQCHFLDCWVYVRSTNALPGRRVRDRLEQSECLVRVRADLWDGAWLLPQS